MISCTSRRSRLVPAHNPLRFSARSLLAAGTLLGASLLVACGDSPTAKANKDAAAAADKANRIAVSAGDARPTKAFNDSTLTPALPTFPTPDAADEYSKSLKDQLAKKTDELLGKADSTSARPVRPSGVRADDKKEYWRNVLDEPVDPATKLPLSNAERALLDLKKANQQLDGVSSSTEINKALATSINSQKGGNSLAQAKIKLSQISDKLVLLSGYAASAQALATEIQALSKIAAAIEGDVNTATLKESIAAAETALTEAEAEVKAAEARLAEASKNQADANAAAAIEEKAGEELAAASLSMPIRTRAQVDASNAKRVESQQALVRGLQKRDEAAGWTPKIDAAKVDLELAQSRVEAAKIGVKSLGDVLAGVTQGQGASQTRAKALRDQIALLAKGWRDDVGGKAVAAGGLEGLVKDVDRIGKEIDKLAAEAESAAKEAQTSFSKAAISANENKAAIGQMATDKVIAEEDVLRELAASPAYVRGPKALEAVSAEHVAQARLASLVATRVRAIVAKEAAGALPDMPKIETAAVKSDAAQAYTAAIALATPLAGGSRLPGALRTTDIPGWIGHALLATCNQGLAIAVEGNDTAVAAALKAAKSSAEAARAQNPFLEFPGILPSSAFANISGTPKAPEAPKAPPAVAPPAATTPSDTAPAIETPAAPVSPDVTAPPS